MADNVEYNEQQNLQKHALEVQSQMHQRESQLLNQNSSENTEQNNINRTALRSLPESQALVPQENDNLKKLGIQNVELSKLKHFPDNIKGPQDFGGRFPYESVQHHMRQLDSTVRPLVEQGYTNDQFQELDRQHGLSNVKGLAATYSIFYGSDAIKAEYDSATNTYNMGDGNHRLFVAKEMGLTSLPVRIMNMPRYS